MRKDGVENFILTRADKDQVGERRQRMIYLMTLSKWLAEQSFGVIVQGQCLLRPTTDRMLMIA